MNAGETAKYLAWLKVTLPVMEAFAKGEEVEWKYPVGKFWRPATEPEWSKQYQYRIKPKPMERWVVVNHEGCTEGTYGSSERAKQIALKYGSRVVHMREVMEE